MRVGSLFSGAGLGDYGLMLAGMDHAWFCETDPYCRKILALRWPDVPCYGDIREFKGSDLPPVDLLAGGPPCQPFSLAGKRRGEADDRNLWPDALRLVREIRPSWILFENVSGVLRYLLSTVVPSLEDAGYQNSMDRAGTPQIILLVIPASAFGAPHERYRIWLVAYADCLAGRVKLFSESERQATAHALNNGSQGNASDPDGTGFTEQRPIGIQTAYTRTESSRPRRNWWDAEPRVCGVVHRSPDGMERIRVLGNGQVVQVAEFLGRLILEADTAHG